MPKHAPGACGCVGETATCRPPQGALSGALAENVRDCAAEGLAATHPNGGWWHTVYLYFPPCRETPKCRLAIKRAFCFRLCTLFFSIRFGDARFCSQLFPAMPTFLLELFSSVMFFFSSPTTHVYLLLCFFNLYYVPPHVNQSLKCDWWRGAFSMFPLHLQPSIPTNYFFVNVYRMSK